MALYSALPVYKESYDLLVDLFRFVKDFHREYKYTIGESIFVCTVCRRMNSAVRPHGMFE